MGVSPAYVGKLLKGRENLTLETIWKIQVVLGMSFFHFPFRYAESYETFPDGVAEDVIT